jgi:O-methyltransferase domain/Dimerisation domain
MNIEQNIEIAAAEALRQMIMGFRATQLIHVAAKLGIADRLQELPQTAAQLAPVVGAEPQALHRVLRALASLGIFREMDDGRFDLTPLAHLLRRDATGSMRNLALIYGEEWVWQAYGQMLHSVQTGEPAFEAAHGKALFDYLEHQPAARTHFQDAMSSYSAQEAAAILAAYDFARIGKVVDIGGGHGALIAALLQAHSKLSGIVFDLPAAAPGAARLLADAGVAHRATFIPGDFFHAIPPGGDRYLLKSVLHNWDDDAVVRILRKCYEAMAPDARLLVAERVIPRGNGPSEAKLFDINMLIMLRGRERTEHEYAALFQQAGFELTRVIPTRSTHSLIEGVPV